MGISLQTTQWDLLPSIRAELVREMKRLGVKQNEIAERMGLTPAAVSQYLKGKRGNVDFDVSIQTLISNTAKRITSNRINQDDLLREIFELCIKARKSILLERECG